MTTATHVRFDTGRRGAGALWSIGFRPLYLAAAFFAAASIALWVTALSGSATAMARVPGPYWHAHEMLFGFTLAVIVGFLFTAVRNWTGLSTPRGVVLVMVVALWACARVAVGLSWYGVAATFDVAFALAAALGVGVPLVRSRNRRNYFFILLLLAIGGLNLGFYLAAAGVVAADLARDLQVGLDLVLFILAVMGGRVIPMFTANAVAEARPRRVAWVERVALASVLMLVAADAVGLAGGVLVVVCALGAASHLVRWALWQPARTIPKPIVWILHAAYFWIPVHLALRAFAAVGWVSTSIANHALTVGAIGGLTIGMMSRTARGHSGRPLRAGRSEVLAYAMVLLAAVVRVFVPLVAPVAQHAAIVLAGSLWAAGFAVFAIRFVPVLVGPRADGRRD
ncbi:MAG: NnrS family protein [Betaproteobacteria bacterium]|nr:NnrS family protein [Betaproteobacteria bacterium]